MLKRRLVIESADQGQFFLLVEGGRVTIGGSRKHADTILPNLRVARVHCELEVESEQVAVTTEDGELGQGAQELHVGEVVHTGTSHLRLELADPLPDLPEEAGLLPDDAPILAPMSGPVETPAAPPPADAATLMALRLVVIDGADQGHIYNLAEAGNMTIGRKNADIALHDLYVARVHCQLDIAGGRVRVSNEPDSSGTMINGQPIKQQELNPGDVLRVGNSHLRLEAIPLNGSSPTVPDAKASPAPVAASTGPIATPAAEEPPSEEVGTGQEEVETEESAEIDGAEVVEEEGEATEAEEAAAAEIDGAEVVEGEGETADSEGEESAEVDGAEVVEEEEVAEAEEEESAEAEEEEAADEEADVDAAAEAAHVLYEWRSRLTDLSGQTLGHYLLGPVLGKGRCGVAFQAQDLKSHQSVVIKILSPQFPHDDRELQGFVRVLKTTLPLRHANLVDLYGAGRTSQYTWIAREYVEGENLATVLEHLQGKPRINWRRAVRVAIHLGRALHFAHEHKLTHGKITPHNILIRKSDHQTKLADLTLARALTGSQLLEAAQKYPPLSELAYRAPEQLDAPGCLDPGCDLFSLGIVVYALLTGHPPFLGETAEETLEKYKKGKVAKPTAEQQAIPRDFEAAVLKLLARRKEDRFASAADFLAEAERIAGEHEVEI